MPWARHDWRTTLPAPFKISGAGIYAIINVINGKIYVGSAVHVSLRWNSHRSELNKSRHRNRYLQRAFCKLPEAFSFELIETVDPPTKAHILEREQHWINFYRSWLPENGYNIAPKAESCQGIKRGPEFIDKVSRAASGPWSKERKAAWKDIRARTQPHGWKWSEENKRKHSLVHQGQKWVSGQKEKWEKAIATNQHAFNKKPIEQLSSDGTVIAFFKSVHDAEVAFGRRSNIHAVCKGKRTLCFGHKWRYTNAS